MALKLFFIFSPHPNDEVFALEMKLCFRKAWPKTIILFCLINTLFGRTTKLLIEYKYNTYSFKESKIIQLMFMIRILTMEME